MNRIWHALLFAAVLLSQWSVAAFACNCSDPVPPTPRNQIICPMSGELGCKCCVSEAERTANFSADCEVRAAAHTHLDALQVSLPHFDLDGWFLPVVVTVSAQIPAVQTVHVFCTLHGHDPPDAAGHGLRAPPAS